MNKTIINQSKLEEWCKHYPEHRDFLTNFFSTCTESEFEINQYNFSKDIELYRRPKYLLSAFSDIVTDYRKVH